MSMRFLALATLASVLLSGSAVAQGSAGRWTLGLHGGADLTDDHTLKLLGAHLAVGVARGVRAQVAVTSVIEEPGTLIFATAGAQWSPAWTVRPFVGGGIAMGYQEVGPFSETEFGWMAQGGIRFALRNLTPFAEVRLMGFTGTATQLLVGFESRAY
jgi:hypothetical protein